MNTAKTTNAGRVTTSRKKRISEGAARIDVIVSPKAAEKLERLIELHGSKCAAIEAAILAL